MGIKGTVRRSTDGHIIHANIDTDVIIAEEPPYGQYLWMVFFCCFINYQISLLHLAINFVSCLLLCPLFRDYCPSNKDLFVKYCLCRMEFTTNFWIYTGYFYSFKNWDCLVIDLRETLNRRGTNCTWGHFCNELKFWSKNHWTSRNGSSIGWFSVKSCFDKDDCMD